MRILTFTDWVVKLGDVKEYNGVEQYSYAVVSDPLLLFLFVLARDVQEFEREYEADVSIHSINNNLLISL